MLTYTLTEKDVGEVRFAISPLCEMGLSLRAIKNPSMFPLQRPWLRRTERVRSTLDTDLLLALINENLCTPDLLNPRPGLPITRIADELNRLRSTDPSLFIGQIVELRGEVPVALRGDPRAALNRTVDILEHYWESCFQPHWLRIRAVLETDITYRGRQIAQAGLSAMINTIDTKVSISNTVVSVHMKHQLAASAAVAGRGMTFVPTVFTRDASAPSDPNEPPMVLYAARGQGAMWEMDTVATDAGAIQLLGRTRATLLAVLSEPSSSTELGIRLGVTTSAVNQHLRALLAGRLVTSTRHGRAVLYSRSDLGSALLGT